MELQVNGDTLEETLMKVEQARSWSPRVISKLESFIHSADDESLFRVSPLHWAAEKNVDEHEALDLFLHSSKAGLFYMDWNVICPCCGKITQSFRDLHSVESLSTCKLCFRKDQPNLDDSVQITFTLSPQVRSLRYHHPETLSLEDYCFNYLFEPSTIVAGMMSLKDAFHYVQKHFSDFSPGERISVETEVGIGALACLDMFSQQGFGLIASGMPTAEVQKIVIRYTDSGFEVPLPEMQPGEFNVGSLAYAGTFYAIHPGKVSLDFEHRAGAKGALLVAFYPIPLDALGDFKLPADLPAEPTAEILAYTEKLRDGSAGLLVPPDHQYTSPRLTARRLFTCQTFHDLFRAEVFCETEALG